ncbi:MAG: endo-1,4-beta-xylanase [Treponema sp.]|nr:endo-1,4-beta-xylanase [Treponema sp.]
MKRLVLALLGASLLAFASCGGGDTGIIENADGSIIYTRPDKDGSAVKYNQKHDGFTNVTIINGKAVKTLNPINVNLAEYKNKDVLFDFSCDVKVVEESGKDSDLIWMINEVSANMPQLAREKVKSGEWVTMKGSCFIHLSGEQNFYLSSSGMHLDKRTFYLKNFKFQLSGEGLGKNASQPMDWYEAPSLKEAYKDIFDYIGIACTFRNEFEKPYIANGVARHANTVTAGNEFKPDFVFAWNRPRNFVDFKAEDGKTYKVPAGMPKFGSQSDYLHACKEAGVKMRGHTLVWHSQTPNWFFKEDFDINKPEVSKAEMTARQEWYIKTVLEFVDNWEKQYNNGEHIIVSWDVVNEAVADGASATNWLRAGNSKWYDVYGDATFIVNAFRFANKYAPADVKLVYNDYNCYSPGKLNGICNIIDMIQATPDARIDAVGMQSHVKIDYPAVTGQNSYEAAVQKFISKGLDVHVTELDIANGKNPYSPFLLKAKYKEYYEMFIRNRKTEGKNGITSVTVWGVNDENTWLNNQKEYKDLTQYPLLFKKKTAEENEQELVCKPAFSGVLEAAQDFNSSK